MEFFKGFCKLLTSCGAIDWLCHLVLGIHRLLTLGHVLWDFNTLAMQF